MSCGVVRVVRMSWYLRKKRSTIIIRLPACHRSKRNNEPDPFHTIAVDLYKPGSKSPSGFRYVLTVVDLCTRWVQFIPLRSKYAAEVILSLAHHWFAFHGIPELVLSDRDKEFMVVVISS